MSKNREQERPYSSDEELAQKAQALAALPRDMAVLRMENDNIQALAAAYPRDYGAILADLKSQMEAYPTFADGAIYAKPVGKTDGVMKYAEGLSIRAAEALAVAFRYNRVSQSIEPHPHDPDKARVVCRFTDYQTGRVIENEVTVSPWYKDRRGEMKRHNADRFENVVVKAKAAICRRDTILQAVSPGLKSELQELAQRLQGKRLSEEGQDKAIAAWAQKGVSQEQLESFCGRTSANWTMKDVLQLRHLWTAIEDGETTVEEVFQLEVPAKDRPKPAGGSKADKLREKLRREHSAELEDGAHGSPLTEDPLGPIAEHEVSS